MSAKEKVLRMYPSARAEQYGGKKSPWCIIARVGALNEFIGHGDTENFAWDDAARLAPQPGEGEPIAGPNGEDVARWCPSCECKDSAGEPKCACQCHGNPFAQAHPGQSAEADEASSDGR
jgi:hypothetical protein